MDVYEVDPLVDPRWKDLQQRHPSSSVFHTRGWLEALRRTYGYQPVAFTTSPPGSELTNGSLFCQVSTWLTGRRLVSVPFSDHCSPLVSSSEELASVLNYLQRDLEQQHWQHIEMRSLESQRLTLAGFHKSRTFHFHTLDLRPGLDELFRSFHKDCVQRKIKRAEREAVVYEEGRSDSLLANFYHLLLLTRRRQGLPPQPLTWFQNLVGCLGDALTIRIASKDGRPAAGILTLRHKRSLVYKYGCSDQRFNHLGGTQLLFWRAIQEAKRDQLDELDMGRSENDDYGLVTFKNRWGTTRSTLTYWRYPAGHRGSHYRAWAVQVSKRMFTHMPDSFLTTAGRLLYRHVG
jgi:CelD/BcsL family acetyltransferase involved in cellulose biosynthesis